jgi:hypothetical protein
MRIQGGGIAMFEKTREVVRKDRFGFPEEEFPHRAIIMGSPHAGLSRKELTLMTGCDPILAGDIQDNPSFNPRLPPSPDNFLCTVTVTVDLLGGTRNLLYDGSALYLVHGERKFRLNDEGLLRKRAGHLGVKIRELARALEDLEEHILQTLAAKRLLHEAGARHALNRK